MIPVDLAACVYEGVKAPPSLYRKTQFLQVEAQPSVYMRPTASERPGGLTLALVSAAPVHPACCPISDPLAA